MPRDIDEAWIEEAVERYRRIDALLGDFHKAVTALEVTVRSPDGLIEIVVSGDGAVKDVLISPEALTSRSAAQLSRSVRDTCTAAADAAAWARRKLHEERFSEYGPLGLDAR